MRAKVGDRIAIKGHHVGEHERECEVVALRHEGGEPPYLVRWEGTGREDLFFPGPDAAIVSDDHR